MRTEIFWILGFLLVIFSVFLIIGCSSAKKPEKPVGGHYDKATMKSFINPPKNMPFYLQWMGDYADHKAKKEMLTGKILAWSPKIAISSGLLELWVEEGAAKILSPRMLTLIRMMVSYTVPNAFAIDINAQAYTNYNITPEQLMALQGKTNIEETEGFSEKEKAALEYAKTLSKTPVVLTGTLLDRLRQDFSEKEITAICALTAKVNFWARLIEGLRVKPAGFTDDPLVQLDKYDLMK